MSNKAMDKDYLLRQLRSFEGDVLAQKSIASEEGYHNFRYYNGTLSYKDGNTWENIDLGNTDYVELTQQEYDQLSTAEKMNGTLYFITDGQGQSVDNSIIADEFDATESYSSGDYCIHDGKLYKFNTSHTGAWDSADADETLVSDEFGEGGGGGIINGSTVTPTDDVSTWLACAGLHQSYTTLNEVLADSAVLSALMASSNAVDYLVRSTTWASDICANETAMNCIGVNDYCADILLGNSTWRTAICNSTYFEEVLNVHVPKMTSDTQPSGTGTVVYHSQYSGNEAYKIFASNHGGGYLSALNETVAQYYVGFYFDDAICVNKAYVRGKTYQLASPPHYYDIALYGGDSLSNLTKLSDDLRIKGEEHLTDGYTVILSNTAKYRYYVWKVVASDMSYTHQSGVDFIDLYESQFYGRGKSPVVDTKADISAIAPEEAGSTASRDYAVGEHFYKNSKFCTCIQPIAQGATFTLGTNYVEGTIADYINPPAISEMVSPTEVSGTRFNVVEGGYKQIGKRVYVNILIKQNKTNFPEMLVGDLSTGNTGYDTGLINFPTPKNHGGVSFTAIFLNKSPSAAENVRKTRYGFGLATIYEESAGYGQMSLYTYRAIPSNLTDNIFVQVIGEYECA